jgi:hypothetical protein
LVAAGLAAALVFVPSVVELGAAVVAVAPGAVGAADVVLPAAAVVSAA